MPGYYLGHSVYFLHSADNILHRIKDCIDVCIEIVKFIEFSPKYEMILESMKTAGMIVAKSYKELKDVFEDYALLWLKKFSSTE